MLKPRPRGDHAHFPNLSIMVHRKAGKTTWATMTRLWYDGCEISSAEQFEAGEHVEVALGRMGNIRARVTGCKDGTVFIRFDEECPV
ncbi:MAG TPA: hypothetical protein VF067_00080 [Sphingomicrobium sp.]